MTTAEVAQLATNGGFAALAWYLVTRLGPILERMTNALARVEKQLDDLEGRKEAPAAESEAPRRAPSTR